MLGDVLDRSIRKQQEWGLMPIYAFMTCVYSTEKMSDSIGFPGFPSWLGKNSSERKNRRLCKEVKNAIFPMTLCSSFRSIKNLYSSLIIQELASMLKQKNIEEAVIFMESYNITPGFLSEHLVSLASLNDKDSPLAAIPSGVKASLTRLFNKRH